jgi:hypothetical protein
MARTSREYRTVLSGGRPQRQSQRAMHLDMLIGFLGFFGMLMFVATVADELSGETPVIKALILLGFVLAIWGLFRLRGKV